jgi:hypothetical protein
MFFMLQCSNKALRAAQAGPSGEIRARLMVRIAWARVARRGALG